MPAPVFTRRVTSMTVLDYLNWVAASREPTVQAPLALPPVQRSALWRPRQILGLWRSLLAGMPVGSFYLSRPGPARRQIDLGGRSGTTEALGESGFDLLDGQQRTHAMLLAIDPPGKSGKCVWVEVLPDRIELHLTTRSQPFGFDTRGERLGIGARARAWEKFAAEHPEHKGRPEHEIFDLLSGNGCRPPMPQNIKQADRVLPLNEVVAAWRRLDGRSTIDGAGASAGMVGSLVAEEPLRGVLSALERAEVAFILAEPPMGPAGANWLLDLFDRIGAGGTPLSGPERLFSMYKHHVPRIHDAVDAISRVNAGLLEPVEVARTAIRIAATMKEKPAFWEPAPAEFQHQVALGGDLRPYLDALIDQPLAAGDSRLGRAFATVRNLLRYVDSGVGGPWDIGFPSVLIATLHPELLRTLVYWAVLADGRDVDAAREDVVRFALFWHLCVTYDGKAAVNGARVLYEWQRAGSAELFPWRSLVKALTGVTTLIEEENAGDEPVEAKDPSALRLILPEVMRDLSVHAPPSPVLRSWKNRFEHGERPNAASLFHRWWWRNEMLMWLQRGYIHQITPERSPAWVHEDDRLVDLDHIQPRAGYERDWRAQKDMLPTDDTIRKAFRSERSVVGGSIGNFRWVHYAVNRSDGDDSVEAKLRLAAEDWMFSQELRPGARDGAMDPASRDLWLKASGASGDMWTQDRIATWQQAVEERTVWLYECLWREGDFDTWRAAISSEA